MLEKIVNISASSDYKNPTKTGKQFSKSGVLRSAYTSLSDSILFSPAVTFMTSHHWKLNRIDKENDKVIIDFELDGIRILLMINENDLIRQQDLEYRLTKNIELLRRKISIYANFISFISADMIRRVDLQVTLPHLNNFFKKLTEASEYVYQLSENHIFVQETFEQDAEPLKSEFEYLNSCVVNFLEMYLSKKFVFSLIDKNQGRHLSLSKLSISKT